MIRSSVSLTGESSMIFLYTAPLILIVLLYLRRRTLFYATTTRRSIFLFLFSLNLFSFGFGACRISKYASNIRQTGRIKHFLASAGEGGVFPEVHSLDISFFASLIGIVALSLLVMVEMTFFRTGARKGSFPGKASEKEFPQSISKPRAQQSSANCGSSAAPFLVVKIGCHFFINSSVVTTSSVIHRNFFC